MKSGFSSVAGKMPKKEKPMRRSVLGTSQPWIGR